MMFRHGLAISCAILVLQGCATPEERAARAQAEMQEMMKVYGPACDKLGFAKDTDQWRQCVLQLASRDERRYRATTTSCVGQQGYYNCITY